MKPVTHPDADMNMLPAQPSFFNQPGVEHCRLVVHGKKGNPPRELLRGPDFVIRVAHGVRLHPIPPRATSFELVYQTCMVDRDAAVSAAVAWLEETIEQKRQNGHEMYYGLVTVDGTKVRDLRFSGASWW